MTNSGKLLIPDAEKTAEIMVVNSRFIGSISPVFSAEEARSYITKIRGIHPTASHHVPAFIIGHGPSVIEHCSDDGEPSGTAGRPVLTVLKGSGLGDVILVITRYFGGTKLGTGGLVRAYTDAAKAVLDGLPLAEKKPTYTAMLVLPYALYERVKTMIPVHSGRILDEDFSGDITLTLQFPVARFEPFQVGLLELSSGRLKAEIIETIPNSLFPAGIMRLGG